ncbi:MAG: hypothetical protein ACKV2T_01955 [Kofleriaceae bacterium]
MKPSKLLFVLAFMLLVPTAASAQGYRRGGGGGYYQGQPPSYQLPGGFWNRQGRLTFGGSFGLGGMSDRFGDIECMNCDYNPLSAMVEGHIGGFIGPRLALLGEVGVNGQTVSSDLSGDTTTLIQGTLMIAAQFWITPQLWIKGGIGFANLRLERSYYGDGIVDESSIPENGMALMAAVGYELLSSRHFAIELTGRLVNGAYKGIDNTVTGGTIGVGVNWY